MDRELQQLGAHSQLWHTGLAQGRLPSPALPSPGDEGTAWLSQGWAGAMECPLRELMVLVSQSRAQLRVLGSPFLQQHQMLSLQFEFSHLIHFRD